MFGSNLYNKIENTFKFGLYRYWDNSRTTPIYFDYILRTRSFKALTGKTISPEELYKVKRDYRYLNNKDKIIKNIKERQ